MRVLAVDPGGTTGVAYWEDGRRAFWEVPGGLLGFVEFMVQANLNPEVIVCESFIPRPGAKSMQYDALWIGGWLQGISHTLSRRFVFQSPAQAKSFATNDKLKAAALYPVGQGHAQDAARHLLVYLMPKIPALAQQVAEVLR